MELHIDQVVKINVPKPQVTGSFSEQEKAYIHKVYPDLSNSIIAINLKRSSESIQNYANRNNLRKSEAFMKNPDKCYRFKKGNRPWNTGVRYNPPSEKTRFVKGNIPANYKPVGYERINSEGYIDVKIADPNIFRPKHRVEWEKVNGTLPPDKILVCKTDDRLNTDPSNWMAITRAEHVRRNNNREKASETMKAIWRSERIRVNKLGLPQKTKLRIK